MSASAPGESAQQLCSAAPLWHCMVEGGPGGAPPARGPAHASRGGGPAAPAPSARGGAGCERQHAAEMLRSTGASGGSVGVQWSRARPASGCFAGSPGSGSES
ncbi:unnamed protein product [Prorocentrum cordatum]|uniref:Uncharacterized protein n=1 Tax=Prorocentrum cordatum TaxID=2364126 RepID=A0ABN9T6Z9_9DINO|nr:unnamed protein product [Polarella glacialis]